MRGAPSIRREQDGAVLAHRVEVERHQASNSIPATNSPYPHRRNSNETWGQTLRHSGGTSQECFGPISQAGELGVVGEQDSAAPSGIAHTARTSHAVSGSQLVRCHDTRLRRHPNGEQSWLIRYAALRSFQFDGRNAGSGRDGPLDFLWRGVQRRAGRSGLSDGCGCNTKSRYPARV